MNTTRFGRRAAVGRLVAVAALALAGCRPAHQAARPPSPTPLEIHTVDWPNITLPGAVCRASQPIQLAGGSLTMTAPAGVQAGTPQVVVAEHGAIIYGDLNGSRQDEAAVYVTCANTGGTAEGLVQSSWVVYSADSGSLKVVGTLTPQQPPTPNVETPYFDTDPGGLVINRGAITVKEVRYAPGDPTCCPSITATTVWTYANGALQPSAPSPGVTTPAATTTPSATATPAATPTAS
jgi:hypothetical protein